MTLNFTLSRRLASSVAIALCGFVIAAPAFAGQCPADKVVTDATKAVSTPASGVTDTVLNAIDLANEPAKIAEVIVQFTRGRSRIERMSQGEAALAADQLWANSLRWLASAKKAAASSSTPSTNPMVRSGRIEP